MSRRQYWHHLFRDLFIISGSIVVAMVLVRLDLIEFLIEGASGFKALSSFVAGMFFTSIFTLAPAGVALANIGETFPPVLTAFFGALGAMMVDLIILRFIRRDLSSDLEKMSEMAFRRHLIAVFHFGFLKWVAFFVGLLFITTPLPDEPGLFLLGLSKINHRFLPLVFFIAHFIGIWALVSVALVL